MTRHQAKKVVTTCWWIFLAIALVTTPLGWDVQGFFASAHLASIQYGGGISGVFDSWELKPFGNRIFIWLLYKLATFFVSFENKTAFEAAIKVSYLLSISGLSVFLAFSPQKLIPSWNFEKKAAVFFLVSFSFLGSAFSNTLQAEDTALALSLLAFGFFLLNRMPYSILGGFLLSFVFYLKMITGIFAFQVFLVATLMAVKHRSLRKQLVIMTTGFLLFSTALFILVSIFHPQEFRDLAWAITRPKPTEAFIGPLKFTILSIYRFLANHWMFGAGIIAGLSAFFLSLSQKKFMYSSAIVLLFFSGFVSVTLQGRGFAYHYLFLVFPGMFSLFLAIHLSAGLDRTSFKRLRNISAFCVLILCLGIFVPKTVFRPLALVSPWFALVLIIDFFVRTNNKPAIAAQATRFWLHSTAVVFMLLFASAFTPAASVVMRHLHSINRFVYHLDYNLGNVTRKSQLAGAKCMKKIITDRSEPILYLSGNASYFLGNPSHSRYFFPMVIEYWNKDTVEYAKELKHYLAYRGPYIIADNWLDSNQFMTSKTAKEYNLTADCAGWRVFVRKQSFHPS